MQELSIYDNAKQAVSILIEIDEVKEQLDKSKAVAEYMRRAGDKEMATKAAKYSIYCQRQAGILLAEMDKNNGGQVEQESYPSSCTRGRETPKTLEEMNITYDQSSQYQKLASIDEDKFDKVVEIQIESGVIPSRSQTLKLSTNDHIVVTKNTGNNEWYTPEKYIESARKVMGSIDVDPASNDIAQETVKAKTFYTIDDDGLDKEWIGNVWMNPPYSAKEIKLFINKLLSSNFDQAIVLTNNSTDTSWFFNLADACDSICFTKGRINFYNKNGESSSPTNGQTFFYFGENKNEFRSEFIKHGFVVGVYNVNL